MKVQVQATELMSGSRALPMSLLVEKKNVAQLRLETNTHKLQVVGLGFEIPLKTCQL